jgi:threonine synthase
MILDAVRASGGAALEADESGIAGWMHLATRLEGLSLCPEAAVGVGVLERALASGVIRPDETVVLFNTGAAQKYVEALAADVPHLAKGAVDWDAVRRGAAAGFRGSPEPLRG